MHHILVSTLGTFCLTLDTKDFFHLIFYLFVLVYLLFLFLWKCSCSSSISSEDYLSHLNYILTFDKNQRAYLCRYISGLLILVHCSMCKSLQQYHRAI